MNLVAAFFPSLRTFSQKQRNFKEALTYFCVCKGITHFTAKLFHVSVYFHLNQFMSLKHVCLPRSLV